MLRLDSVTVQIGDCRLHDVNFQVDKGNYFVLLGESGVGKTVLLETIAGLISPTSGFISIDGKDVTKAPIQRRGIGLVYQNQALFPHMTASDNIAYSLSCRKIPKPARKEKVREISLQVGAGNILDRLPRTLSQGEAQRVALARALMSNPKILLLDEPLASLDITAKSSLRALLRRIHADGMTIVHVTHDYEEAIALATRVAVLENGTISQEGDPSDVFHHPRSQFVASFVGVPNFFRGEVLRKDGSLLFESPGFRVHISADTPACRGSVVLGSDEITLSNTRPDGSARNCLPGKVVEIEKVRRGVEITVDVGVKLNVLVTPESASDLAIATQKAVWVSFKASSLKFIPEEATC